MTKQDIIDHLTNNCGLHRSSAIRAVEGVINSISDALARGEAVTLRGFATIKPVENAVNGLFYCLFRASFLLNHAFTGYQPVVISLSILLLARSTVVVSSVLR